MMQEKNRTATHEFSCVLQSFWLDTPLEPMLAISDNEALYLLEFSKRRGLKRGLEKLQAKIKTRIVTGTTLTPPVASIKKELAAYFSGNLKTFKTPIRLFGSPFQRQVWQELMNTPYGKTRSYLEQAKAMGHAKGVRAVANANGANTLAIVIPCHRIINTNGQLGGYGGGLANKQWLIEHEAKWSSA